METSNNHYGSWHEKTLYTQHYRGSCLGGMEVRRLGWRSPERRAERSGLFVVSAGVQLVNVVLQFNKVKVLWREQPAPALIWTGCTCVRRIQSD